MNERDDFEGTEGIDELGIPTGGIHLCPACGYGCCGEELCEECTSVLICEVGAHLGQAGAPAASTLALATSTVPHEAPHQKAIPFHGRGGESSRTAFVALGTCLSIGLLMLYATAHLVWEWGFLFAAWLREVGR